MSRRRFFVLEIANDQKNTWQGQIQYIDEKKEYTFHSALEMFLIMDSLLSGNTKYLPEPKKLWSSGVITE